MYFRDTILEGANGHQFIPLVGLDNIKFGMNRSEVEKIIKPKKSFFKTKFSKNSTDVSDNMHIYYDENNSVEAIEIHSGATVFYKNNTILPADISQIKTLFNLKEIESDHYIDYDKSIAFYAPEGKDIKSLTIGVKGYFE